MFYEMPLTETFKPKMENTKLGMVTVSGGDLTVQDVITQMKWLVPFENFQWEVVL
jgi:hypothetical protein